MRRGQHIGACHCCVSGRCVANAKGAIVLSRVVWCQGTTRMQRPWTGGDQDDGDDYESWWRPWRRRLLWTPLAQPTSTNASPSAPYLHHIVAASISYLQWAPTMRSPGSMIMRWWKVGGREDNWWWCCSLMAQVRSADAWWWCYSPAMSSSCSLAVVLGRMEKCCLPLWQGSAAKSPRVKGDHATLQISWAEGHDEQRYCWLKDVLTGGPDTTVASDAT